MFEKRGRRLPKAPLSSSPAVVVCSPLKYLMERD